MGLVRRWNGRRELIIGGWFKRRDCKIFAAGCNALGRPRVLFRGAGNCAGVLEEGITIKNTSPPFVTMANGGDEILFKRFLVVERIGKC